MSHGSTETSGAPVTKAVTLEIRYGHSCVALWQFNHRVVQGHGFPHPTSELYDS
jgi:hypothetical protein